MEAIKDWQLCLINSNSPTSSEKIMYFNSEAYQHLTKQNFVFFSPLQKYQYLEIGFVLFCVCSLVVVLWFLFVLWFFGEDKGEG